MELGIAIAIIAVVANITLTVIHGVKHNLSGKAIMANIAMNLGVFALIAVAMFASPGIALTAAIVLLGITVYSVAELIVALKQKRLDSWDIAITLGIMLTYVGFAGGLGFARAGVRAPVEDPIVWEDPTSTNYSQRSMRNNNYSEQMQKAPEEGGWDWSRPDAPLERVTTPSGKKVSLDNRRLAAAKKASVKEVPFRDHGYTDPLPADWASDPYWSGKGAKTWGDVLRIRTQGQNPSLPLEGTPDTPSLR